MLTSFGWLVVGTAVALSPWVGRNYFVTGHLVPTTLWVGPSLYDGLHPGATGDSDMTFFEQDQLMVQLKMSEYDMDREYRRRAMAFMWENPGRAMWLAVVKQGRYWSLVPNAAQFRAVGDVVSVRLRVVRRVAGSTRRFAPGADRRVNRVVRRTASVVCRFPALSPASRIPVGGAGGSGNQVAVDAVRMVDSSCVRLMGRMGQMRLTFPIRRIGPMRRMNRVHADR